MMAGQTEGMSLPPGAESVIVSLPNKPSAKIACTYIQGHGNHLVVFLNGLGLPQSQWWPGISQFLSKFQAHEQHPSILTYDRYGQGLTTDPDPQDDDTTLPPGHRHDLISIVHDLEYLLMLTVEQYHGRRLSETSLVFVANSIGCTIARFYANNHQRTIAALLLLDSYMTDTNFVDLYPDPEAPDYDESKLPDGITTEDIIAAREGMGKLFRPDVVNKEGFWRGNITSLLPCSYTPKLVAPPRPGEGPHGPFVTVVGHDWEVFAEESLRMKGMTKAVVMNYTNPAWGKYNEGLLRITDDDKSKWLIAEGAGHFIQQYRPDLVAEELKQLVEKVT